MNFTSFHFLLFFAVTIVLGHVLKNRKQRVFLLLASYYFYGVFEPWYLILILGSTALDYMAGLGIEARRLQAQGTEPTGFVRRLTVLPERTWLVLSLVMNLALLGYFKYTNFGIEILNDLQPYGDTVFAWPAAHILLPIGISFYTFQSMSYTIDVYRGVLKPRRDITDFALYVAFFPQLVAGPIVRATTFLSQLDDRLPITKHDIMVGTTRIVVGFFRKLVLADNMGIFVNAVFGNPGAYGVVDMWVATIAFGFQIYLDFAGYTDIARGVARLFGFEFDINFLYPMASGNITEHWSRWHISLTTWLRDYVYIPLGGSKVGPVRLYGNIFTIWLLTGIWHGPAYHFVAWGVWQFVMVVTHRQYKMTRAWAWLNEKGGILYAILSRVLMIFFLNFGFIWFRAETMFKATFMQGRLFGIVDLNAWLGLKSSSAATHAGFMAPQDAAAFVTHGLPGWLHGEFAFLLGILFAYEYLMNYLQLEYFWKPENRWKLITMLIVMIFCIIVFASPATPNFMYFQF